MIATVCLWVGVAAVWVQAIYLLWLIRNTRRRAVRGGPSGTRHFNVNVSDAGMVEFDLVYGRTGQIVRWAYRPDSVRVFIRELHSGLVEAEAQKQERRP